MTDVDRIVILECPGGSSWFLDMLKELRRQHDATWDSYILPPSAVKCSDESRSAVQAQIEHDRWFRGKI